MITWCLCFLEICSAIPTTLHFQCLCLVYNMLKTSRQADRTFADLINRIENNDSGLKENLSTILGSVRGTKQYWLARGNEVTCMVHVFDPPTLFLTFSCAEYDSADITERVSGMWSPMLSCPSLDRRSPCHLYRPT